MENFNNEASNNSLEKAMSLEEKVEKLEAENKELKDKLENRDKLLGILAHDLRSPLGLTTVMVDSLLTSVKEDSATDKQERAFLEMISVQSKNTFKLLEDLLAWIRIQKEGISVEMLNIDLSKNVNDSISPLLGIAKEKEIKLENKVPNNTNISTDTNMLQTVIRNITSNAIKYTHKGGNISILSEQKGNVVEVHIADDGIGLSEKSKNEIFSSLAASRPGTEGEKGTRFGLAICKEFMEKMNGSIRVESEGEGKGTTFILTLPTEKKDQEK